MKKHSIFSLIGFLILFFSSIGWSTGCGTFPAGVTACYPVNIINTQASATSSGFQIEFNGLPFNALSGNFLVYNGLSGDTLPTWVENSSLVWVNLGANIIPASGSVTGTYYLGVGSSSTNFFISGNNIGEAPQLSSSYGEYDNGNQVFTGYWNFSGTTLPTAWTQNGGTSTVNNGLTETGASTGSGSRSGISLSTNYYGTNYILEGYGSISATDGVPPTALWISDGSSYSGTYNLVSGIDGSGSNLWGILSQDPSGSTNTQSVSPQPSTTIGVNAIWGLQVSGGNVEPFYNYGSIYSSTTNYNPSTQYPSLGGSDVSSRAMFWQWARIRTPPPNYVMPTITYGSVTPAAKLQLSFSSNPSTYPNNVVVTSTCIPSTDSCALDYPTPSTQLCIGTGSCSYTYAQGVLGAGSYSYFYANDLTAGVSTSGQTLTVNKASSPLSSSSTCSTLQAWSILGCYVNFTAPSYKNQTVSNLWLKYNSGNYNLINSTSLTANYVTNSIMALGNYSFTFNTLGNGNYTSNSINFGPIYDFVSVFSKNVLNTGTISTNTITPLMYIGSNQLPTYYPIEIYTALRIGFIFHNIE